MVLSWRCWMTIKWNHFISGHLRTHITYPCINVPFCHVCPMRPLTVLCWPSKRDTDQHVSLLLCRPHSQQWGCYFNAAVLCERLPAAGDLLQLGGGVPALPRGRRPPCRPALVPGRWRRHLRRAPHPPRARQRHPSALPVLPLRLQQHHPRQRVLLHCWEPSGQDPKPQHPRQSRWDLDKKNEKKRKKKIALWIRPFIHESLVGIATWERGVLNVHVHSTWGASTSWRWEYFVAALVE